MVNASFGIGSGQGDSRRPWAAETESGDVPPTDQRRRAVARFPAAGSRARNGQSRSSSMGGIVWVPVLTGGVSRGAPTRRDARCARARCARGSLTHEIRARRPSRRSGSSPHGVANVVMPAGPPSLRHSASRRAVRLIQTDGSTSNSPKAAGGPSESTRPVPWTWAQSRARRGEPVGDPRGAGTHRDLDDRVVVGVDRQQPDRPTESGRGRRGHRVQPPREAESVAQRRQQAVAGHRSDHREWREFERYGGRPAGCRRRCRPGSPPSRDRTSPPRPRTSGGSHRGTGLRARPARRESPRGRPRVLDRRPSSPGSAAPSSAATIMASVVLPGPVGRTGGCDRARRRAVARLAGRVGVGRARLGCREVGEAFGPKGLRRSARPHRGAGSTMRAVSGPGSPRRSSVLSRISLEKPAISGPEFAQGAARRRSATAAGAAARTHHIDGIGGRLDRPSEPTTSASTTRPDRPTMPQPAPVGGSSTVPSLSRSSRTMRSAPLRPTPGPSSASRGRSGDGAAQVGRR